MLQPGLTRQQIDDLTASLPFALAEEVYELYQWRNGQSSGEFKLGLHQARDYPFLSMQEALNEYTQFQAENFRYEVDELDEDFAASGGWFPLFGMDRDYTATLGQPPGQFTSLLVWVMREDTASLHYPSLTAMLEFRADLYDAEAMRSDTDGWYWADYTIASVIQRQHFPEQVLNAEENYRRFGTLNSPRTPDHYNREAQRNDAVCRLISSGSTQALSVVAEYLQEQIDDKALAASVLNDLLIAPNKVSKEWPWTRNMYTHGLPAHFEID